MHHFCIYQRGDMEMKENKFDLIKREHYSFFFNQVKWWCDDFSRIKLYFLPQRNWSLLQHDS